MYHDKEKIAARLYEILDDLPVGPEGKEVSIDELLTPQQKYSLIMSILNGLPPTNFEMILEFNRTFAVKKEDTHVVKEWQGAGLAFRLIMEEALELGFAMGLSRGEIYSHFVDLQEKAESAPKNDITAVFDALLDLLYVTYRNFYTFNLIDIAYEGMEEVHGSNMSKLVPTSINEEKLKQLVKELRDKGNQVETVDLKNGYIMFKNAQTGKVLKPSTYREADLNKLIFNLLNK